MRQPETKMGGHDPEEMGINANKWMELHRIEISGRNVMTRCVGNEPRGSKSHYRYI